MTDILLVTAILRTENLIHIAKSIVKAFKDETEIHPVWVMCFDQFNANMSPLIIKKTEVYCLENNLTYVMYYQGDEGKKNYGGTLMNAPLEDLKEKVYKDSNPLVYVLDDDNIIHPNFVHYIKNNCLDNENTHWLNMIDEFGTHRFVRYADRLAFLNGTGNNEGYRIIHPCASCDPSQVVIRLNTLLNIGGFGNAIDYDYQFMNKIYGNYNGLDATMRYQGTTPWMRDGGFYMSCYHNGLVTKELIEETKQKLEEKFSEVLEDSYIRIHIDDKNFVLPLTNTEVLKILQEKLDDAD